MLPFLSLPIERTHPVLPRNHICGRPWRAAADELRFLKALLISASQSDRTANLISQRFDAWRGFFSCLLQNPSFNFISIFAARHIAAADSCGQCARRDVDFPRDCFPIEFSFRANLLETLSRFLPSRERNAPVLPVPARGRHPGSTKNKRKRLNLTAEIEFKDRVPYNARRQINVAQPLIGVSPADRRSVDEHAARIWDRGFNSFGNHTVFGITRNCRADDLARNVDCHDGRAWRVSWRGFRFSHDEKLHSRCGQERNGIASVVSLRENYGTNSLGMKANNCLETSGCFRPNEGGL